MLLEANAQLQISNPSSIRSILEGFFVVASDGRAKFSDFLRTLARASAGRTYSTCTVLVGYDRTNKRLFRSCDQIARNQSKLQARTMKEA